jgi:hypothetical protein
MSSSFDQFVKFSADQGRRILRAVRWYERQSAYDHMPPEDPNRERRFPNPTFQVKVYADGGGAGGPGGDCTYTYTVKTLSGRTLATAKSPTRRRFPLTEYAVTPSGAVGQAYFDDAGTLQLFDANELPALEDC